MKRVQYSGELKIKSNKRLELGVILSLILAIVRLVVKVLWKIISLYILSRYIGSYLVHKNPTALAVGVSGLGVIGNDN